MYFYICVSQTDKNGNCNTKPTIWSASARQLYMYFSMFIFIFLCLSYCSYHIIKYSNYIFTHNQMVVSYIFNQHEKVVVKFHSATFGSQSFSLLFLSSNQIINRFLYLLHLITVYPVCNIPSRFY